MNIKMSQQIGFGISEKGNKKSTPPQIYNSTNLSMCGTVCTWPSVFVCYFGLGCANGVKFGTNIIFQVSPSNYKSNLHCDLNIWRFEASKTGAYFFGHLHI